ncbi:farnesyl diphosphate synthase [Aestuariibacter sp. A3R04]|uniref:farnesyl diphosphate synthase n=1 Tax=Aestuariibacter sp. A3R04 TaxID=2841571 RepID=UPI001C08C9B2|nr:farnesyl diphosphate synthase [Aestuariibacter sp. A3R04]MBU3021902.1 polyprenyl synthetase family protein [Aestuariibacter sp. A3R04]
MTNFDALRQQVKQRTDDGLLHYVTSLPDHAPTLKSAMAYALTAGGKRMRPLLVNLIGNALDIPQQDQLAISMAIECIHAYSLAHDDLPAMDDDDLRRGQPTCHVKFDEATAILAGDALQTMAFSILVDLPMSEYADKHRAKLVSILARASGYLGMCGGQAIDLAATGTVISPEALTTLHTLKTGALLKACAEMITQVSDGLPAKHRQAWIDYASYIGLAFQIQDDILDVEGDAEIIGKPQGSDVAQGKSTFPALLGMDEAKFVLSQLHDSALQALASLPYNTDTLSAFTELMVKRTF